MNARPERDEKGGYWAKASSDGVCARAPLLRRYKCMAGMVLGLSRGPLDGGTLPL